MTRLVHSSWLPMFAATLGACTMATHEPNIAPSRTAAGRASTRNVMLAPAAMKATPVMYAHAGRPGIQAGTSDATNSW